MLKHFDSGNTLRSDWFLVGAQLISLSCGLWFVGIIADALHLHPLLTSIATPPIIYISFTIGAMAVWLSVNPKPVAWYTRIVVIAVIAYWSMTSVVMFMNDQFHSVVSLFGLISWPVPLKVINLARRGDFVKRGGL